MKLLTKALRVKLPKLYEQEKLGEDAIVYCKFFVPWNSWKWYVTEFDGEDICFGKVVGLETELGYFSLKELSEIKGPGGLRIERDMWFKPCKIKDVKNV